MAWGRIDDKFHAHRKVVAVAKKTDALGAWVRMVSWCCDQRTGGLVPRAVAIHFATQGAIDKLVAVALLDIEGDDYRVHDFANYNRGTENAEELTAKRSEAGKRGAAARWGDRQGCQTDGKPNGTVDSKLPSEPMANAMAKDASRTGARARPDPDPDPDPDPSSSTREGARSKRPGRPELVAVLATCEPLEGADLDGLAKGLDAIAMNVGASDARVVAVAKHVNALILTEAIAGPRAPSWYRTVATRLMKVGELERSLRGGVDERLGDRSNDASVLKGSVRF